MIVKICGIKNLKELEIVERYADFGGIVVKSKSKRCVSLEKANEIISSSGIPIFVVSTAGKFEEWEEIISKTECDFVQVHGEMSFEDFEKLKEETIAMKAFLVTQGIKAEEILGKISLYDPDFVLLDSGYGSGRTHDWRISREVARFHPIILAGGLKKENVADAIRFVCPAGVDVSSGVERDGFKDESLVFEFVKVVRNAIR